MILNDNSETLRYALKVNGKIISASFISRLLAEQAATNLSPQEQNIVEIVTVDINGNELLLG